MNTHRNTFHKYLCWLDQIRYLGRKSIFALLSAAGENSLFADTVTSEEKGAFAGARTLYSAPEAQLRYLCSEAFRTPKRAEKAAGLILKARKTEPERIEENLTRAGISFCCFLEEEFPDRLRAIPDPPFGLYHLGETPFFGLEKEEEKKDAGSGPPDSPEPAAAIIGARLASGYGREQARRFSRRLASRGITIISGMARGIDGIAQKAALDAGGKSYAVLGCGVDICYPEENRELYERLLREGGILSEYPPGTFPEARLFPQRNRIISGLSDMVLVIEARRKSGTLITVDMALEQGRDVYALPGRVSDSLSDGCNRLIRQGAGAATCPEDILEYFFGTGAEFSASSERKKDDKEVADAPTEGSGAAKKEKERETDPSSAPAGASGAIERDEKRETDPSSAPAGDSGAADAPSLQGMSLEQGILRILSREDETHVERIMEGIQVYERQKLLKLENIRLSDVVTCLIRLKIDGRIEETSAGYYKRGEW